MNGLKVFVDDIVVVIKGFLPLSFFDAVIVFDQIGEAAPSEPIPPALV